MARSVTELRKRHRAEDCGLGAMFRNLNVIFDEGALRRSCVWEHAASQSRPGRRIARNKPPPASFRAARGCSDRGRDIASRDRRCAALSQIPSQSRAVAHPLFTIPPDAEQNDRGWRRRRLKSYAEDSLANAEDSLAKGASVQCLKPIRPCSIERLAIAKGTLYANKAAFL